MSHSHSLLTREQKINLMNGYIRENAYKYMPRDLIDIVRLFYNNLRSLNICGGLFSSFVYRSKAMVSSTFSVNDDIRYRDIQFRMGIYPNGLLQNKCDAIEFYVKLKSLSYSVDRVSIYYSLYCSETESEWKGVICMALNEYIVWSPYMMRLSLIKENKSIKSLFFCCDIKILSLHFKNGTKKEITAPIIMNKNEEFLWKITDRNTLSKLYTTQYGYCHFSSNFGGSNGECWCLKYYPQGIKSNDFRGAIFIRLLRKPINIKRLMVKYVIEYNNTVIIDEVKEFSDTKHSNGYWMNKLSTKECNKYGLRFNVKMNILEIYNDDDQIIKPNNWSKYGISRLKPF